jgi:GT2 family glycosyltransferase
MRHVLAEANDDDWIIILDDDRYLRPPDHIERLEQFGLMMRKVDSRVGGVGWSGKWFDWKRGKIVRPKAKQIVGVVAFDYLPAGHGPMVTVAAVRACGPFRKDLFFGMSEVEFCLRLRRHGYSLYSSADLKTPEDKLKTPKLRVPEPTWRRYYSLRNLIVILRDGGHPVVAARVAVVRGLLKPLVNLPVAPVRSARNIRINARAIADAFRGRLGRTVDPPDDPVYVQ